jgi:uncharacterized protein (UPF0548 family)
MAKRESMRGRGADAFYSDQATSQQTSLTAHQQASTPVLADAGELVKATFYLTSAQVLKLEQVRLARRQRGQKVDKSALVREAIEALVE